MKNSLGQGRGGRVMFWKNAGQGICQFKKTFLIVSIFVFMFLPAVLQLVFAQEGGKISFHLSVIKKTTQSNGDFNFTIKNQEPPIPVWFKNYAKVFAFDLSNQESNFSISTQNRVGNYEADYEVPANFFAIDLIERASDGWEIEDIVCRSDNEDFFYQAFNGVAEFHFIKDGDNIECEFTNKPAQNLDKFVYVALGDSYQAGEGAGNSIADTNEYLAKAYENGKNYPWIIGGEVVGGQTNTYVNEVQIEGVEEGDGCHRALDNYAKTIRDKLDPDAEVILIDQTCSGAKIGTGDKNPVVGDKDSGAIDPNSQVAQVISQLESIGLVPSDVDLVTVGMGGNDAKFVEIVQACLTPNILRKVLEEYPNPPAEIKTLVDMFGSCKNIDDNFFHSSTAIDALYGKEIWAQTKLLETFSSARVMQVNYPDILPKETKSLTWCGGLRKEDIGYARGKIKSINEKIVQARNAVSQSNPRLELVNIQNSLGDNPLCPANSGNALANSINEANFNAEVRRLLNIGDTGDAESREKIDELVGSYNSWKQCWSTHLNLFDNGADCDTSVAEGDLRNRWDGLSDYIASKQVNTKIFSNLIASEGSGESVAIRFDRSQGLFHPNISGHKITACNVLAAYNRTDQSPCLPVFDQAVADTVNGNPASNVPVNAGSGNKIHLYYGGFMPNTVIPLIILSTPRNFGTVTSDSQGIVDADIVLPEADPGVHTIILESTTTDGTGIAKQFRVNYPGDPKSGGSYGMYFDGFAPDDGEGEPETVEIVYGDKVFTQLIPDEEGGVFVELPVFPGQDEVKILAQSQVTGRVVEQKIKIADTVAPEISIVSPEEKTYYNTDGLLPINYLITDNVDPAPKAKFYFDGTEIATLTGAIDLGKYLESGEHKIIITVMDASGNTSEKTVTFQIAPQPMASFLIKDARVRWSLPLPKNKKRNPGFMISGRFELPVNFKKTDLSKDAIISLALADSFSGAAKINFNESGIIWKYKGSESASGIKINHALIYWSPENNFCDKSKACASELKNKNWFYIRGELMGDLSIDDLPKNISVDIALPLAPFGQKGSLAGSQTVVAQKLPWFWIYRQSSVWNYWKDNWWKSWDNYSW
jgi:hypothetical protein